MKKVQQFLKSFDLYGMPLNFSYRNKQKFKTPIGGVLTIMQRLLLISYVGYAAKDVLYRENNISNKSVYKDMASDKTQLLLTPDNFDIGVTVQLVNPMPDVDLNHLEQYIDISFQIFLGVQDPVTGALVVTTERLESEICGMYRFKNMTDFTIPLGIPTGFYCPKDMAMLAYGSQTVHNSQPVVFIKPCDQAVLDSRGDGLKCANESMVNAVLDNSLANVAILASYFDSADFE